jgi:hypothetical protein
MLFQFLKQNMIYTIIFLLNVLLNIFSSLSYQYLTNFFPTIGVELLSLPSMIFSGLYFIVMASGIIHFGVFAFYQYKKNEVKLAPSILDSESSSQ